MRADVVGPPFEGDRYEIKAEDAPQGDPPIAGAATVTLTLNDGSRLSRRVDIPKGDPRAPVTWEELAAKYRDCAAGILSAEATERSLAIIDRLETAPSVRDLMDLVCLTTDRRF